MVNRKSLKSLIFWTAISQWLCSDLKIRDTLCVFDGDRVWSENFKAICLAITEIWCSEVGQKTLFSLRFNVSLKVVRWFHSKKCFSRNEKVGHRCLTRQFQEMSGAIGDLSHSPEWQKFQRNVQSYFSTEAFHCEVVCRLNNFKATYNSKEITRKVSCQLF